MRELELSCARIKHLRVDSEAKSVEWCLPASKTDVMAVGKMRRWECVCTGAASTPCPFHAVVNQLMVLRARFGQDADISEMPFFPSSSGGFVEKRHVVLSIEHIAAVLGESLVDSQGVRRFGGHSLRVTGARMLAGMGIDLMLIQLMARWSSNVVLRYVAEAPLEKLSASYRGKFAAQALGSGLHELTAQLQAVQQCTASDARSVQYLKDEVALMSARVGSTASQSALWIRNGESGVVHRPLVWSMDVPPSMWRAYCGWTFGFSRMEGVAVLPDNSSLICGGCLKPEKRAALLKERLHVAGASASSDSSSASSSS
jgi:hypothetical protein